MSRHCRKCSELLPESLVLLNLSPVERLCYNFYRNRFLKIDDNEDHPLASLAIDEFF